MSAALTLAPAEASPAAPTRSRGSPWLVSARFDVLFFLASALVVLIAAAAVAWFHVSGWNVLVAVAIVSNGPHLTSTWTRVYLDRKELGRRPAAYLGGPLLIGVAVLGFMAAGPAVVRAHWIAGPAGHLLRDPFRILNSVVLYWATYHFAAQCYGLLRLYQRRSAEPWRMSHRVEAVFVFATAVAGILWRLSVGPRWLFGAEAISPPIPFAVVEAALVVVAGCLAFVIVDQVTRARAGAAVAWTRLAFMGAVLCGFWVPFMVIKDGTAAFAAAACWHGFQYLGIVYHFNRQKFAGGPDAPQAQGARLVAWVSQPRREPYYVALLLAMAGGAYVVIGIVSVLTRISIDDVAAAVWVTLTLSHYLIDGFIWKLRRGEVATVLRAPAVVAAA